MNYLEMLESECGVDILQANIWKVKAGKLRHLKPQPYNEFKISLDYMTSYLSKQTR